MRRATRILLPALVIVAWLAIGAVGGPLTGKLSSVGENSASAFLPSSAESTEADRRAAAFTDTTRIPAVIVAERDGPVTDADRAFLAGLGAGPPPVVSADGRALQRVLPIPADDEVADTVTTLRERTDAAPAGLTMHIGGPAGQAADLSAAFAGIDGLLLLVAGAVVLLILLVVYRSPLLPLIVITSAVVALALAAGAVYLLADSGVIDLNGQSQGILFILVFGAATDYALLLVSRYREELGVHDDRFAAMAAAWRATVEPVAASAGTVIAGVLCLLLSDLNSNRGLGPVAALGIAASLLASLTFLPAVLVLVGRAAFWPRRPQRRPDTAGASDAGAGTSAPAVDDAAETSDGVWPRLARRVAARPRPIWIVCTLILFAGAAFAPTFEADGVAASEVFLVDTDSVAAQSAVSRHFDAGTGAPTVIVAAAPRIDAVAAAATQVRGVASVLPVRAPDGAADVDGRAVLQAVLTDPADSTAAEATVERIRAAVHDVADADALVGGPTAVDLDTKNTAARDRTVIIPLVALVVFLLLIALLRSLLAPLLLMATVILSFAATLGVSSLLFEHVFGFPGADPVVPLFAFVFLVALGIDYNIFLMTRVREETRRIGTRRGVVVGLSATGAVITSAGIVLAATFSALAVIPLIFLAQIAFLVAFGVLLDALLVRTLLVPALAVDLGGRFWWPSRIDRTDA